VIRNFNADGFDSLYPRYRGGPPAEVHPSATPEIKKIAKSKSAEHVLPLAAWSLSKLAEFLVAEAALSSPRTQPPIGCDLGRGVR
jgi:hypothetical protein